MLVPDGTREGRRDGRFLVFKLQVKLNIEHELWGLNVETWSADVHLSLRRLPQLPHWIGWMSSDVM